MAHIKWQPKNWNELLTVYNKTKQLLNSLINSTNKESQVILNYIQNADDPSNIIEECIKKCPQFVPHVRQVKEAYETLKICYQCMNNQKWLESQPEYFQEDDDESSGSGGGFSIIQVFNDFEPTLAVVSELNLNLNHVFDLTYTLQHSQDKYVNKMAVRDLAKKMAKQAEKAQGKDKSAEKAKDHIQDQMYGKVRTPRGM